MNKVEKIRTDWSRLFGKIKQNYFKALHFLGGRYIDTIWKHILVWWVQWPILFAGYLYEIRISCDFDECVNVPIKKDWRPNGMILEDRLLLCKMRSRYQHSWQNHKIWVTCNLLRGKLEVIPSGQMYPDDVTTISDSKAFNYLYSDQIVLEIVSGKRKLSL